MENTLILCGGTGAHTGVAFLRLHTLGYALGFFDQGGKPFDFPGIFLVDQDAGDSAEREPTAWQLVRSLVEAHPARHSWAKHLGRAEPPELVQVTPLPIGPNQAWFQRPYDKLKTRFESSPLVPLLASDRQQGIEYSKGMMGSPSIGSLLFRLKRYDERSKDMNHDESFGQLLESRDRIVIAGSGVGGTGASVAPTLAAMLSKEGVSRVMAVMILNWFEFDETDADDTIRAQAQRRNRLMRENANSSFEFYGQTLARSVATVPVGMPEQSLLRRQFTSDVGQPIQESFVHAVAALTSSRHFLNGQAFGPGLYMMGAVEPGRLAPATAIPGGTLQGLANQALTLWRTLEAWRRVLNAAQDGRVRPAIWESIAAVADPRQVADHLGTELAHYKQQIEWLGQVLGIEARAKEDLTRQTESRDRLGDGTKTLELRPDQPPEQVASALFHWTARWIREQATPQTGLEVHPGPVGGAHWPKLNNQDGLGVAARTNGGLDRVNDADRDVVLNAFVDKRFLSCNGWPHPLAPVEYFRHAVQRHDPTALRQLELLLVGLVSGVLEAQAVDLRDAPATGISLERLLAEYRREDYPGAAEVAILSPGHGGRVVAFNSPYTLLCPTPQMDEEEGDLVWEDLWRKLTGAADGAAWHEATEPPNWGENENAVKQVRAWIEQQRRVHGSKGNSPPWSKVFERRQGAQGVPFGSGMLLQVYWGTANDAERQQVQVNLPAGDDGREWVPPPGTPALEEEELWQRVPGLRSIKDSSGNVYQAVDFEVPGFPGELQGFWDDHLNHLKEQGQIHIWSQTQDGAVLLGTMEPTGLHATRVPNSRLLTHRAVTISTCTPLAQQPVLPTLTVPDRLYPQLPIRSDYLDLVLTSEGESLLQQLKVGDLQDEWQPESRQDTQGRKLLRWRLQLRGRPHPMTVDLRLSEDAEAEPSHAHWMVWPNFRTRDAGTWKAYYIYENSDNNKLHLETLWLDAGARVERRRRPAGQDLGSYPIRYQAVGGAPRHEGGPPLAFVLHHGQEEQGIYLIPLQLLGETPASVNLAIDFGTSHSVAAARVGSDMPTQVDLLPELQLENTARALTLHVSHSEKHAPVREGSLPGNWMPTYTKHPNHGMLPSELILTKPVNRAKSEDLETWEPATNYLIPALGIGRDDLAELVLSDFKWDTGSSAFRGRETQLRSKYLALFVELVLADVIAHHARDFPVGQISLTFTYPLRSRESQVQEFQKSLHELLQQASHSLGLKLALHNNVGIYDESRAAQLTTERFGEVCLVADLGGGTLDLFISAKGKSGKIIPQIADSTRLGGNLLLRQIANSPQGFVPSNGTWGIGKPEETETKLRSWMRSSGASALFGLRAGGSEKLPELSLQGYDKPAEGERPRTLLDRYFRLLSEYMARSLAAFLYAHWYPNVDESDHDQLAISIQLRGNGWKLRYQDEDHVAATNTMQDQIKVRVNELWRSIDSNGYPNPAEKATWLLASKYRTSNPKGDPIRSVVGKSMEYGEVKDNWHTHTLVDLDVMRVEGRSEVPWHSKVPFHTGGSKHVEVGSITPPLILSSPFDDKKLEISSLEAEAEGLINSRLQGDEGVVEREKGTYRAPVAPLVWEAIFDYRAYWPGRGDV